MKIFDFFKKQDKFYTGGLIDKYDSRDYEWTELGGAISDPFDWDKGYDIESELSKEIGEKIKIRVKNQGTSSSCGGQAFSYYDQILTAFRDKNIKEKSAKYIYAQTYVNGGGSYGRDNCNIIVKQGDAEEAVLTSYENGNPPSEIFMERSIDITEEVRNNAKKGQGLSYANVYTDIDTIAKAIRDNKGVVILIAGSNNGTWRNVYPVPSNKIDWRHFLYCGKAKKINGIKYIGALNSWGSSIGDNGWQWIGEKYFNSFNLINGCWTIVISEQKPLTSVKYSFKIDLVMYQLNDDVKALQDCLKKDGDFPLDVPSTGYYGDITRRAVKKFQEKYKVASPEELMYVNGKRVGAKTREKLNSLFNV